MLFFFFCFSIYTPQLVNVVLDALHQLTRNFDNEIKLRGLEKITGWKH